MNRLACFSAVAGIAFSVVLSTGCAPAPMMFEQRLNSDDVTVRREAAKDLRGQPRDARLVPFILQACRDQDTDVRVYGFYAIGRVDASVEGVVSALIVGMADTSVDVRRAVASSLGTINPFPNTCLPHMIKMLVDPDDKTRTLIASAIVDLEGGGVGSLLRGMESKDAELRVAVIKVLAQIGTPAKSTLPKLRQVAREDESAEAREAAEKAIKFIEG